MVEVVLKVLAGRAERWSYVDYGAPEARRRRATTRRYGGIEAG